MRVHLVILPTSVTRTEWSDFHFVHFLSFTKRLTTVSIVQSYFILTIQSPRNRLIDNYEGIRSNSGDDLAYLNNRLEFTFMAKRPRFLEINLKGL